MKEPQAEGNNTYGDLGNDDTIIRAAVKKQYHLSDEEINNYL